MKRSSDDVNQESLLPNVKRKKVFVRPMDEDQIMSLYSRYESEAMTQMVGREVHRKALFLYIARRVAAERGGFLYLAGTPGTGKTLTAESVILYLKAHSPLDFTFIKINGATFSTQASAYNEIVNVLGLNTRAKVVGPDKSISSLTIAECKKMLDPNSIRDKKPIVLFCDEVDMFGGRPKHYSPKDRNGKELSDESFRNEGKKLGIVNDVLKFVKDKLSKVVFIGAGNDLFLEGKKLSYEAEISSIRFPLYSKDELRQMGAALILKWKYTDKLPAPALEYISKEVAASTGDARQMKDVLSKLSEDIDMGRTISMRNVIDALMDPIDLHRLTAGFYDLLFVATAFQLQRSKLANAAINQGGKLKRKLLKAHKITSKDMVLDFRELYSCFSRIRCKNEKKLRNAPETFTHFIYLAEKVEFLQFGKFINNQAEQKFILELNEDEFAKIFSADEEKSNFMAEIKELLKTEDAASYLNTYDVAAS